MKTTSKTIDPAGQVPNDSHDHDPHSHGHQDHDDHDHDCHNHDHETGTAEYLRPGLMGFIVIASLIGWWRSFMDRDWLAFAGTVIGGFPIYKEAWENLLKRRMTMELSMTIALLSALPSDSFSLQLLSHSLFSSRSCSRATRSVADAEQLKSSSMLCLDM